jgi:hypothetical protein
VVSFNPMPYYVRGKNPVVVGYQWNTPRTLGQLKNNTGMGTAKPNGATLRGVPMLKWVMSALGWGTLPTCVVIMLL